MFTFDNSTIRRSDRLLDEERAIGLLNIGEYGFLAMSANQGGYGIPINYVFDGQNIYFHCAPEGRKLDSIATESRVTFCVVGRTKVRPEIFSTEYESVMIFGRIEIVTDDTERMRALKLIIGKYSSDYIEAGHKYASKSFHRTTVLKLTIERISGKCKRA